MDDAEGCRDYETRYGENVGYCAVHQRRVLGTCDDCEDEEEEEETGGLMECRWLNDEWHGPCECLDTSWCECFLCDCHSPRCDCNLHEFADSLPTQNKRGR